METPPHHYHVVVFYFLTEVYCSVPVHCQSRNVNFYNKNWVKTHTHIRPVCSFTRTHTHTHTHTLCSCWLWFLPLVWECSPHSAQMSVLGSDHMKLDPGSLLWKLLWGFETRPPRCSLLLERQQRRLPLTELTNFLFGTWLTWIEISY